VSPIFGHGERYVILEGPKELLGGNLLVALLSESQGFRECHLLNTNRRQRQEFWEHFRSQGLGDLPAVPPAYAVSQLEEAFAQAPQTEAGAGRYGALRAKIQAHWGRPAEAPDLEAGLTDLAPGEQSRFLDQSRLLVLDPLFLSWLPDAQEVAPWLDKIREVQDSPLVLSEQQQQGRFEAVVEEAAAALYPPETRKYWRRRLLHMAYFLKLKGRQEEARAAQAAAADLKVAPPGPLSRENPFLKALVQQALRLAWEFQQRGAKKSPGSGLVLPPTEPLILKR
jgi:hypothetical protein